MKIRFVAVALALAACGEDADTTPRTDVELAPPAQGFQLTTGTFEVPAGAEVQDCYFFTVPENTLEPGEPLWVNRFTIRQNGGTHHMNVFRVNTLHDLKGQPGDVVKGDKDRTNPCWKSANWADWPLVVNSQASTGDGTVDWTLPEGVAQKFTPGELLMLQTHYVNADTQQTDLDRGKVLVNFEQVETAKVVHEMGTLFATNQNISVCPGEQKEFTKTCNFAQDEPLHVIAANGHFHSRGVSFRGFVYDPMKDERGAMFYESFTWDDPPMSRDFDFVVPAKGGIEYTCEFRAEASDCGDPEKECCYTFGGSVDMQEHCNLFLYYYPKQVDFGCF